MMTTIEHYAVHFLGWGTDCLNMIKIYLVISLTDGEKD